MFLNLRNTSKVDRTRVLLNRQIKHRDENLYFVNDEKEIQKPGI